MAASLLNLTRQLLELRRAHPALRWGSYDVLRADEAVLAVRRTFQGQSLLCLFNFTAGTMAAAALPPGPGRMLAAVNGAGPEGLPPFGAMLIEETV